MERLDDCKSFLSTQQASRSVTSAATGVCACARVHSYMRTYDKQQRVLKILNHGTHIFFQIGSAVNELH